MTSWSVIHSLPNIPWRANNEAGIYWVSICEGRVLDTAKFHGGPSRFLDQVGLKKLHQDNYFLMVIPSTFLYTLCGTGHTWYYMFLYCLGVDRRKKTQ